MVQTRAIHGFVSAACSLAIARGRRERNSRWGAGAGILLLVSRQSRLTLGVANIAITHPIRSDVANSSRRLQDHVPHWSFRVVSIGFESFCPHLLKASKDAAFHRFGGRTPPP